MASENRYPLRLDVNKLKARIAAHDPFVATGELRSAKGILLSCKLSAAIGDACRIIAPDGRSVAAEVIGFNEGNAQLVAYEHGEFLRPGMMVVPSKVAVRVPVGDGLRGRILDGIGRPIDDRGEIVGCQYVCSSPSSPPALARARIQKPFHTGQRAIDSLLTLGLGQRVGIFAGSGVGKSTLLGEIAKGSNADVNVIALIGERGREVRPFIEDCLGEEGLKKSVLVVATADQTPLMRIRAVHTSLTIAEFFRAQRQNVLLMVDSLTRLAMAQRELGLALGEPPSARGYTPSVFQLLANTVERMGNDDRGTMTGILTVLVDGGDLDEPISDAVRSLVDGHLVLDRRLAERGQYPAIHIGSSISRVANDIMDERHRKAARKMREILATYAEVEDLIRIGAYVRGTSPSVDRAIELHPEVQAFLRQDINERTPFAETRARMEQITAKWSS
ncbi:MAG: flagellum-specific ATP synthase [Gemmatales bacterium]|nr:MAG: flagellum-specific ATP synthase [Gemmatales bacterium]